MWTARSTPGRDRLAQRVLGALRSEREGDGLASRVGQASPLPW